MASRKKDKLAQQVVFSVSKILAEDMAFESALATILKSICQQLGWQTSAFWKWDESKKRLSCEAFYTTYPCPTFEGATKTIELEAGIGLPGRVLAENAPMGE